MDRRELLGIAAAGASLLAAGAAAADEHDHGHDHAAHMGHSPDGANARLAELARACVTTAGACLSHCLQAFAAGDTSLGSCARSVYQMSAVCEALARLAAAGSERLADFSRVANAVCLDCEKECRKHQDEHAECKACAESCAACAEECKKHFT
ncbi:MAG: Csp1 family four helix bundle copper storage protein [Xanthobacteraceae bacterium]|nr:Csp1 family four helix bundle copper storage protein [Xanthobacteraceae bacterium]